MSSTQWLSAQDFRSIIQRNYHFVPFPFRKLVFTGSGKRTLQNSVWYVLIALVRKRAIYDTELSHVQLGALENILNSPRLFTLCGK
jgi:hypothetical protein